MSSMVHPFDVSLQLLRFMNHLHQAKLKDDEDERNKYEDLIRPLLTCESVNSVDRNGAPTLGVLAIDSYSLLTVALQHDPNPDILSRSLHHAIRDKATPTSSIKALIDAGADVNFIPPLIFTHEEEPGASSGSLREDCPLACVDGYDKDDPEILERVRLSIYSQNLKALKLLLAHNADPNKLTSRGNPFVAVATQANYHNGKDGAEAKWFPRDTTSDLILVALLRHGITDEHLRYTLSLPSNLPVSPPPAQRALLRKVLDRTPAWYEVCSSIVNLKLCKCVSVAYCGKECQRADWKKHKRVCAAPANEAIQTQGKAAIAREQQKKNDADKK